MVVHPADGASALQNFVVISESHLSLVLVLLVVAPVLLPLFLVTGHSLVFLNHRLVHRNGALMLFVLEHATHPENGLLLSGPCGLFLSLGLGSGHVFTALLVGPVLLILCVELHPIVVHCNQKPSLMKCSTTKKCFNGYLLRSSPSNWRHPETCSGFAWPALSARCLVRFMILSWI